MAQRCGVAKSKGFGVPLTCVRVPTGSGSSEPGAEQPGSQLHRQGRCRGLTLPSSPQPLREPAAALPPAELSPSGEPRGRGPQVGPRTWGPTREAGDGLGSAASDQCSSCPCVDAQSLYVAREVCLNLPLHAAHPCPEPQPRPPFQLSVPRRPQGLCTGGSPAKGRSLFLLLHLANSLASFRSPLKCHHRRKAPLNPQT